jgi:hypothetical protein
MRRVKKTFKFDGFEIAGFVGDNQLELTILIDGEGVEHIYLSRNDLFEIVNCAQEIFTVPLPKMGKMWVGLTGGEVLDALVSVDKETVRLPSMLGMFARAIEAKLKEKNT